MGVVAQGVSVTAALLMGAQHRPQTAANEAIHARKGEPSGVLEIAEPTAQHRVQQGVGSMLRPFVRRGVSARIRSRTLSQLFLRTVRRPDSNR